MNPAACYFAPRHVLARSQDVQEEGGLHLTTVLLSRLSFDEVSDIDGRKVEHGGHGVGRESHEQRLHMPGGRVRRDEDELPDPMIFPICKELVHGTMEGLATKARRSGEVGRALQGDAVLERRCPKDAGPSCDRVHHRPCDVQIRPQGEVGSRLLESAYGEKEPRVPRESTLDGTPVESLQIRRR